MTEPSHPLDRPLPPDVAAGESAFIQYYQKYTVFSWPWAWRRTALFSSIGIFTGVTFGASHGLYVKDAGEAVIVSLCSSGASAVLLGAGPILAAFVRHRRWPRRIEHFAVVAALILGIVLGVWADSWADQVHDALMAAHGHHANPPAPSDPDTHSLVRFLLFKSRDLLFLSIAGGAFALPAYFSEKRRWAEHRRRADLEMMGAQKSESDLKLTLLQAQVEPHFLFNTLASVRSLVTTDPQRAAQTIDALATHLRTTLPKLRAETGTSQSTLAEQFAICASYLELMKIRLGDRLSVALELPADLRAAPFPPLLLISLVENAIKHGAEPKPGMTHLRLAARAITTGQQPKLEVSVDDDGAGLTSGAGTGTGLANIRAQLLTRFGLAASFELTQRASGGVSTRLVIPLEAPRP